MKEEKPKRKSRAKKPECNTTLIDELRLAEKMGQAKNLILDPREGIEGKLIPVEPDKDHNGQAIGWAELAATLSLNLPGQFWVGSNSISWVNGGKPTMYLAPVQRVEGIREARQVCKKLTNEYDDKIPCSISGCARKMLEWVAIRQQTARSLDFISNQDTWAYQHCDPKEVPQGYFWDMTSCYFSLLRRAPSPKVLFMGDKLVWCEITKDERARWGKMLEVAAPHKGIRNSFIGQMYAGNDGLFFSSGRPNKNYSKQENYLRDPNSGTIYQTGTHLDAQAGLKDEQAKLRQKPGPLRPLACLIVRSAYELCAMAAKEQKAFYANTDGIISEVPHSPLVWGRYGVKSSLKGRPNAAYRICWYNSPDNEYEKAHLRKEAKAGRPLPRSKVPLNDDTKVAAMLSGRRWVDEWLQTDAYEIPEEPSFDDKMKELSSQVSEGNPCDCPTCKASKELSQ